MRCNIKGQYIPDSKESYKNLSHSYLNWEKNIRITSEEALLKNNRPQHNFEVRLYYCTDSNKKIGDNKTIVCLGCHKSLIKGFINYDFKKQYCPYCGCYIPDSTYSKIRAIIDK